MIWASFFRHRFTTLIKISLFKITLKCNFEMTLVLIGAVKMWREFF